MKIHTSGFKNAIKTFGRELDSKITYTINGTATELGNEELNSVSPHYEGGILKSVMKQLDINCDREIPIGTILNYQFGVKVGNAYEYISFGDYVVYNVEKQEDTLSYNITCYDKMLYSMKDYESMNITYPITIRNYIGTICSHLGLTFKNSNNVFANYNKEIPNELYLDENGKSLGYTFRDVLDELAQVTASTICINETDGQLEVRYITNTNDTIDEEFLKDVNVNFGEKYGAINTIVLSRSAGTDNIYYPSTLPQNPIEIKISDNQIMNRNDRDTYLPDIYNKLNGLEYYINDFSSTGICYYNLCDRYTVQRNNTTYSCVMLNNEINVTQGLEELIYTDIPEEAVTDYSKADKTDRKINQTTLIVDKQQGEITALVESVEDIETPIASTSGSTLYLQDSADAELIDFSLEGKTTQETKEYINLYNTSMEQGSISGANGSPTSSTTRIRTTDYILVNPNTEYLLDYTSETDKKLYVFEYKNDNTFIQRIPSDWTTDKPFTFTTSATTTKIKFIFAHSNDTTITASDVTNIELYEPYYPSPDYPSELVSVGYENLAYQNTMTVDSNGYLNYAVGTFAYVESGKTYTLTLDIASSNTTTGLMQVRCYTTQSDGTNQGNVGTFNRLNGGGKITLTFTSAYTGYLAFNGSNMVANSEVFTNIQVVKGTQPHSYIPYGKYGIEIKNTGKNLFDGQTELGTFNLSTGEKSSSSNTRRSVNKILVQPNTRYIFSRNGVAFAIRVYYYQENGTYISTEANSDGIFTTPSNCYYVNFISDRILTDYSKLQLEKGSQATNYEPYTSHTNLITLDEPLRCIGDTKDRLFIQDSVLYVERKIGSVVLDGTENTWSYNSTYKIAILSNYNWEKTPKDGISCITEQLSSHFKGISDTWTTFRNATTTNGMYKMQATSYRICLRNVDLTSLEDWTTWLGTNKPMINYVLNESIIEALGEVQIPSTYEGITHILTTDELEPNMNITYVRNTAIGNYVEGQVNSTKTIEERHYAELKISDSEIIANVNATLTNYSTTTEMNAAITLKADEINQVVSTKVGNDEVISKINQSAESITINANKLNLQGYITATDLSTSGSTIINGSNITTGTIDASTVSVTNINADNITGGTINGTNVTITNLNASNITSGTLSADNVSGGTLSGASISIGNTDHYLKMGTSWRKNPEASGLSITGDGGINIRSLGFNSDGSKFTFAGGVQSAYFYVTNGLTINSGATLTCYGNIATNQIKPGGYLQIATGGRTGYGTNSGSIYMYASAHITLNAAYDHYVYIGNANVGNTRAAVDGSGPSSRCLKTNISEFTKSEYTEALQLLDDIKLYDYKYKYNIHPKENQYGFIIDDLLDNKLADKFLYFRDEKAGINENNYLDYSVVEDNPNELPLINFKRYDEETLIKYLLVVCKALQYKIDKLELEA